MSTTLHTFDNGAALAEGLADAVSAALAAGIATRGTASIAVSGGSTPKAFFQALARKDIAWDKVTVTLVDERFVPPESDRSNHALVTANLLQGPAAKAHFLPLYHAAASAEDAAGLSSKADGKDRHALRRRRARHGNGWPYRVVLPGRHAAFKGDRRDDAARRDHRWKPKVLANRA